MKRTLVNHGGVIQWKFIISSEEELVKYAKHKSIVISQEFVQLITKKSDEPDTKIQEVLKFTSSIHNVPMVSSCEVLLKKIIMSMHESIKNGVTLVVNEAGGYCYWDDSCMTLIEETEENIAIANGDEPVNQIHVNLDNGPILVLENQKEIPETVEDYIILTLGLKKFSYIKNIQFDKESVSYFIKEALAKKHHTFVVQTTLMDMEQVEMIVSILESIPYKISFLIRTSENLEQALEKIIGSDRTSELFKKHKIFQW